MFVICMIAWIVCLALKKWVLKGSGRIVSFLLAAFVSILASGAVFFNTAMTYEELGLSSDGTNILNSAFLAAVITLYAGYTTLRGEKSSEESPGGDSDSVHAIVQQYMSTR